MKFVSQRDYELCERCYEELDMDGDGGLSVIELKLWLPRIVNEWPAQDLPRRLRCMKGQGDVAWGKTFEDMDSDESQVVDRKEFRKFWHLRPPAVFVEGPVSWNGEDFLMQVVRSPLGSATHLQAVVRVLAKQGILEHRESILSATQWLICSDARRDFLEVLLSSDDDVRSCLMSNHGLLLEDALSNGSWQALHTILANCPLIRRESVLTEMMVPLLTSEQYFHGLHGVRLGAAARQVGISEYANSANSDEPPRDATPEDAWLACVDVLICFGLTRSSLLTVLESIASGAMRKLIKRLLKVYKPPQSSARGRHSQPIKAGSPSPMQFQSRGALRDRSPLRTAAYCYLAPPKKYVPTPPPVEEVPLEERHPLIEHWKRRMDEDPVYVREDVSRKLAASAVWPTAAERSSETSFRRKKRAIRTHNAKTTYSPIGGFAAWASGSEP